MAAKKGKRAAPRKPPKRVRRKRNTAERTQAVTKPSPTGRMVSGGGALLNASPLGSFMFDQPPDSQTFDAAAQIAAWRQTRSNPALLTGGAVEPVPVPLESFPRVTPQPNLRTAGPQLNSVSPIPDVTGLDEDEAVDVIKEWFLSNFEDPAQSTPRVDGEFLYTWGGPYDARDEIGNAFGESVSEQIIEAAIAAVEAEGIDDWAPHSNRQRLDYDEQADNADAGTNALHAEMVERISALEKALAALQRPPRGIGDNNPPEPIEPEPLSLDDLRALSAAIAILKEQPPAPNNLEAAAAAATQVQTISGRLRSALVVGGAYAGRQADHFVTEAVKSAGSELGKRLVQSPIWLPIISQLPALAYVAHRWLESIGAH